MFNYLFSIPFFLPGPIPVLLAARLSCCFLPLREADLELGTALAPVQVEWHQRVALALHGADQAIELASMQQQLAAARRVGLDVRRRRPERREVRPDEPGLAVCVR